VRTKAKNEIHAALVRRLVPKPKVSDLFGLKGRRWLEEVELPPYERETVDGCLRQLDFCEREIAAIERVIAKEALASAEIRRLMTIPGMNIITASAFMAAIGDVGRFPDRKKLVGYLGLDPKVRESGTTATSRARISKQGSSAGRYALVEASWSVILAPGPMRAFFERMRARRGHQAAIVAVARKLACLCWCMLTRGEDYAYAQPSLTAKKIRRAEIRAGAQKRKAGKARHLGGERGDPPGGARARPPGRGCLQAHCRRLAANPGKQNGRRRDTGARILKSPIGDKQRGGPKPQASLFSSSSTDARPRLCHRRSAQTSRP
jgi:transposase